MDGKLEFNFKNEQIFMNVEGDIGVNEILNAVNTTLNCLLDSGWNEDDLADLICNMIFLEEPDGEC